MYGNSPFKNKNIDKMNGAGKATTANSMMSAGPGDPPKKKQTEKTAKSAGEAVSMGQYHYTDVKGNVLSIPSQLKPAADKKRGELSKKIYDSQK